MSSFSSFFNWYYYDKLILVFAILCFRFWPILGFKMYMLLLSLSPYHELGSLFINIKSCYDWYNVVVGGFIAFCSFLRRELSVSTGNYCFIYVLHVVHMFYLYNLVYSVIIHNVYPLIDVFVFSLQFNETCISNAYPPNKT